MVGMRVVVMDDWLVVDWVVEKVGMWVVVTVDW